MRSWRHERPISNTMMCFNHENHREIQRLFQVWLKSTKLKIKQLFTLWVMIEK